jgi:hypothetical protein
VRVYRPRRIDKYLEGLAYFLNTAHANATEKEWRLFLKRIEKNGSIGTYFFDEDRSRPKAKPKEVPSITLQEAKDIRGEMHHDTLAYLRSDKSTYQHSPYARLVDRLNRLELKTQYECQPANGKVRPGQAILRSHEKNWASRSWLVATNVKELLYTILARALVNGTLNRLQVCKECGKYITVKDRKRRFCPGTSCKDDFFNRQKKQDLGFKKDARLKRKVRQWLH